MLITKNPKPHKLAYTALNDPRAQGSSGSLNPGPRDPGPSIIISTFRLQPNVVEAMPRSGGGGFERINNDEFAVFRLVRWELWLIIQRCVGEFAGFTVFSV